MVSDRWAIGKWGSRKPYMLLGLALFSLCYSALTQVSPREDLLLFGAITWLASFGLAWFDTCADGWAIDVASEQEASSIQAAMISGKSLGLITTSLDFGFLAEHFGVISIFWCLAGLSGTLIIMVGAVRPVVAPIVSSPAVRKVGRVGMGYWILILFAIVYSVASFGLDGILSLFLFETKGLGLKAIGQYGVARGSGALLGAVGFALLNRKLGVKLSTYLAVLGLLIGCLLPLGVQNSIVLGLGWGFLWGVQETSFVTLAMHFARGPWSATLFALSMIFSNVGTAIGEALAAPLIPAFGYSGVFFGLSGVSATSLIVAHFLLRQYYSSSSKARSSASSALRS